MRDDALEFFLDVDVMDRFTETLPPIARFMDNDDNRAHMLVGIKHVGWVKFIGTREGKVIWYGHE